MVYLITLFLFSISVINFPFLIKYKNDIYSRIIEQFITIIYLLLVIVRPIDIIPDTCTYKEVYDLIQVKNYGFNIIGREYMSKMEYGFVYLMVLFKFLGLNFYAFTAFISIFSIFCVNKTVRFFYNKSNKEYKLQNYKIRYLYIFGIFMVYYGLFYNLITIRAMLAIDFLLLMSVALFQKYPFRFIRVTFFFLSAFLIHRMAILGCFFIFFLNTKKPFITLKSFRNILFLITILYLFEWKYDFIHSFFITIFRPFLIFFGYETYADHVSETGVARFLQIVFWIMNAWSIYYFLFKSYKNTSIPQTISKILSVYLFGLIIAVFCCKQDGAYRIFDYFLIFSLFLNCLVICNKIYLYKSVWRKIYFIFSQNLFLLISFRNFAMKFIVGR